MDGSPTPPVASPAPDVLSPAAAPASASRAGLRTRLRRALGQVWPADTGADDACTDVPASSALFDEGTCRNCGVALVGAFCHACGQKKAVRLGVRDVKDEVWTSWRWFEMGLVRQALALVRSPGLVARAYVLGARKRYLHPLKLLLVGVGLLVWVLGRTHYLVAGQDVLSPQMALVEAWSKWSFTVGFVAILASSLAVFGRRLGYNVVEHLVLAGYTQALVIAANLVNLLPLLFLDTERWVPAHRAVSGHYMGLVEMGLVALSFHQFFRLSLRRDAWRLALAVAVFYGVKELVLFGYARLIVHVVLARGL